jgi:hypothetical protein
VEQPGEERFLSAADLVLLQLVRFALQEYEAAELEAQLLASYQRKARPTA